MNKRLKGFVLAFGLAFTAGAQAQVDDFAFGFSPRTGDAWVDTRLGDINVFARGNTDGFIDDVVVSYGAPRYLVRELYHDRRWAPGDIYYACAIAYQLRRPCLDIVKLYERDHGQGWGVIARRLGIKPGSPAFHALKGRVGKGHGKMKGYGRGPAAAHGGQPASRGVIHGPPQGGGKPGNAGGQGKGKGGQDKGKGGQDKGKGGQDKGKGGGGR